MVGCSKVPNPSLHCIFNVQLIGVQYTLSFQWTNFGWSAYLRTSSIRLEDVSKMSRRRQSSSRRFYDVLKTPWQDVLKLYSKHLEDVLKMSWRRFCKTSWKRIEDLLKTSWRRFEDAWLRKIYWSWPRRLLKTYD